MSKGSTPAGNTTTTTVNPAQQAQQPFLTNLYGLASNYLSQEPLSQFASALPSYYGGIGSYGSTGFGNTSGSGLNLQSQMLGATGNIIGGGNPASGEIAGLNSLGNGLGAVGSLENYGGSNPAAAQVGALDNLYEAGNPAEAQLGALYSLGMGGNPASPYANALGGIGQQLGGVAQSINGGGFGLQPAQQALNSNYVDAINGNPALSSLEQEANGAYLNSNPYLSGMFSAASQPVVNAYQTATAPQTDANFEGSGRYGSGALANAQGQNELNLGTSLGNLSSNIYGTNYANERSLQTQAGSDLGSIYNTGIYNANNAASTLGSLGLGEANANISALEGYGNQYANAGQLATSGLNSQANALANSGSLGLSGLNSQINALTGGGSLGVNGLNSDINALTGGGGLQLNALTGGGNLNIGGLNPELTALGLAPSMSQTPTNDLSSAISAMWGPLNQDSSLLGNPIGGSGSVTQPYFTNPLANLLSSGLGGLGLYSGLNSVTGGGLSSGLGSIFGGLFGSGASAGLDVGGGADLLPLLAAA